MPHDEFEELIRKGEHDSAENLLATLDLNELQRKQKLAMLEIERSDFDKASELTLSLYEAADPSNANEYVKSVQLRALFLHKRGRLTETVDIVENFLDLYEPQLNADRELLDCFGYIYNSYGSVLFRMGRLQPALGAYTKSLEFRAQLEDLYLVALSFGNIAIIYNEMGKYPLAEEYYKKALDQFIQGGFVYESRITHNNLGVVYLDQGRLNEAEVHFGRSQEISDEYADEMMKGVCLNNLGNVARAKKEFEVAEERYLDALEIRKRIGSTFQLVYSYFYLCQNSLDQGDRELAKDYLDKLEGISGEHPENITFHQMYQSMKGSYLKGSSRQSSRFEARQIFLDLLEQETSDSNLKVGALLTTCEFLLEELKTAQESDAVDEEQEILSEIAKYSDKMATVASEAGIMILDVQAKFLQAYIALSNVEVEKAKELIEEAESIAEEYGFSYFSIRSPEPEPNEERQHTVGSLESKMSINKIIHSLPKLKIIFYLFDKEWVGFTELRKELGFSAGNLGKHCDQLADVGYLEKTKMLDEDSKFVTVYRLTEIGISEFRKYATHIRHQFQITEMI